jgi:hypothetical protein
MEDDGLIMFENRMLRRIFEPKRNEMTGKWKKLHRRFIISNVHKKLLR